MEWISPNYGVGLKPDYEVTASEKAQKKVEGTDLFSTVQNPQQAIGNKELKVVSPETPPTAGSFIDSLKNAWSSIKKNLGNEDGFLDLGIFAPRKKTIWETRLRKDISGWEYTESDMCYKKKLGPLKSKDTVLEEFQELDPTLPESTDYFLKHSAICERSPEGAELRQQFFYKSCHPLDQYPPREKDGRYVDGIYTFNPYFSMFDAHRDTKTCIVKGGKIVGVIKDIYWHNESLLHPERYYLNRTEVEKNENFDIYDRYGYAGSRTRLVPVYEEYY